MEEMSREEFLQQKADAARRIKELYRGHNMPPYPDFVSLSKGTQRENHAAESVKETKDRSVLSAPSTEPKHIGASRASSPAGIFRFLNLPELLKSPDALLIMGLIFLLMSDSADEKLILALVFIML